MSSHERNRARVIPLRPPATGPAPAPPAPRAVREPLWRHVVGDALRRERRAQERTLKDVAEAARISMPYLSELERGRKEASSEVLAAVARALGLGLADLLALAHGELVRLTGARRPRRAAPVPVPAAPGRGLGPGRPAATVDDAVGDAADDDRDAAGDGTATGAVAGPVTSTAERGTRHTGARAALRPGDVRLAA